MCFLECVLARILMLSSIWAVLCFMGSLFLSTIPLYFAPIAYGPFLIAALTLVIWSMVAMNAKSRELK